MAEYKQRTKADVKKTEVFSYGGKTKSGKEPKHGTRVTFKDDTEVVLLNPSGKGAKYSYELRKNIRTTNDGTHKTDDNNKEIKLTKEQRAYRAGYLDSQSDNAKAYKAKQAKRKSNKK